VGIGASAGGLDALKNLFSQLPNDTGMAFVVVQHLDPTQVSHLAEILATTAKMPVTLASDELTIEPNHVYVMPPSKFIALKDNSLQLTPRPSGHQGNLPLNVFFGSLAAERQHLAIGVILSGTGSDGTLGAGEIKAVGGVVIAQDDKSAQFPGMPQSAIQSGHVDLVMPPQEIARELIRIGTNPLLMQVPIGPDEPSVEQAITPEGQFKDILEILHDRTNVDFGHYRVTTLQRRIVRRMVIRKIDTLQHYIELLQDDQSEAQSLFYDLLINVTSFFRDPEMFDALKAKAFPEMLANKKSSDPVRMWVVGCSTGQEAYSLAITLLEYLDTIKKKPSIQIFASDISDRFALNVARAGFYPESIRAEVSTERLQRFFTHEEGGFRINKSVRDMCVFARQNLIADPPFSKLDLVSCRNVLIYLSTETQKRLIPLFHYALNSSGFLVLGSAETTGSYTDLFWPVDKKLRIYSRRSAATRDFSPFHAGNLIQRQTPDPLAGESSSPSKGDVQSVADRLLLERYAPGAVLVTNDLDVIQFRGRTSPWLEPVALQQQAVRH
jgi:two-component system, chemotaxis family, CheB/CheR fusion protein